VWRRAQERAQSHFPVCAWSQTPILSLVSHLISRKKCMRRALIATGATIRLWYLALVPCQIGDFVCATFSDRPCPFPMQDSMCGDSKPNNNRKRATARTGNIMLSKDEQINSSLHPLTAQRKLQKSCSSSTKDARKSKEQIPLFLVIPKMRDYRPSVRFDNQLATKRFDFHKIMPLTTKCHRDIPKRCVGE
jgi:hypothetical protein